MVLEKTAFIEEVKRQWEAYPADCNECKFARLCAPCVALPYEEGLSEGSVLCAETAVRMGHVLIWPGACRRGKNKGVKKAE